VHFLTKKSYFSIISHNPYIDKIHLYGSDREKMMNKLKEENYDLIIDLHHNLRTFFIKWQLGKKSYSFNKLNIEKWLLVNFKIDRLPEVHIVDRYMDTVKPLGVTNDGEGLDHFIQEPDEVKLSSLPEGFQDGYIAWVIGAKGNTKQFPNEKIINVISSTQMPVILLGGKEDKGNGKSIMKEVEKRRSNVYNAVGQYHFNQSASLIKQARLVITNDTGLMHVAAAFKKKIISIWGNTIPRFGMYPYYGNFYAQNRVFEAADLPCRPCSKIGKSECPKRHFKCMKEISEVALIHESNEMYKA